MDYTQLPLRGHTCWIYAGRTSLCRWDENGHLLRRAALSVQGRVAAGEHDVVARRESCAQVLHYLLGGRAHPYAVANAPRFLGTLGRRLCHPVRGGTWHEPGVIGR